MAQLAVEAGYTLGSSIRLALGYNFSGGANPTLSGAPQRISDVAFTGPVDQTEANYFGADEKGSYDGIVNRF